MDAIRAFIEKYLMRATGGLNGLGKLLVALISLFITFLIIRLLNYIIRKILNSKISKSGIIEEKRAKTVMSILKSMVTVLVVLIWFLSILSLFGVNTSALIATAGVGGIAISFGAKSLVEDIIAGMFLFWENTFAIGDYVKIADRSGYVEELTLRTTIIRDFSGEIHTIPNGKICIVTNMGKDWQRAQVKFMVDYDADIKAVMNILKNTFDKLFKDDKTVISEINVMGVTDLASSSIEITVFTRTVPGENWRVEREMRLAGIKALKENGIEIPYNKLDIKVMENA
ncbi:MAG: mechanosensitive ion channel family protein [Firmicutes bacterium]|nr:mechanosensitive ion channel family protein [Ezakiella sp.]MDD7761292.1 mechanosensitive ion channel family protein [Bacillota bacterium]